VSLQCGSDCAIWTCMDCVIFTRIHACLLHVCLPCRLHVIKFLHMTLILEREREISKGHGLGFRFLM
jgi:hypothetical protein